MSSRARAQTAPVSADKPAAPEEIIVTATKRALSVQQVPASITALTGSELRDRGLSNVRDIATIVPNLNWSEHLGSAQVTIRGVGSNIDSGVPQPTVAVYVDGVYLPRSTMATLQAVDLDRVEVLRGPQGTLYGRNAAGGAINFISQKPTEQFTAGINVGTGSRNDFAVSGYVSGSVAPGVSVRVSGGHEKQDGYLKVVNTGGTINGTDVNYVRGAVEIKPVSNFTADLTVRYEENRAPIGYQELTATSFFPASQQTVTPNELDANSAFKRKVHTTIYAADLNWKISSAVSLRSITSYVDHLHNLENTDADGTAVDLYSVRFPRSSKSFGQEFNLSGDSTNLKWILGAFYFREHSNLALDVLFGDAAPTLGVPAGFVQTQSIRTAIETWALYGDATYSFTGRLRLNLGMRYNRESNDYTQGLGSSASPSPTLFFTKSSTSTFLPKVALQYDIADDIHSYAQWSRGFKAGGINLPGSGALFGVAGIFAPEHIDAYEVGLKTQWLDRRITANVAGYYYKYHGLQVAINVPPATTQISNADANIYGVEAELRGQVTRRAQLTSSIALTSAKFHDFSAYNVALPGSPLVDLGGKELPYVAKATVNAGASYKFDLGIPYFSELTARADFYYKSGMVLRYFGLPEDRAGSYAGANISGTLRSADGKTEVTAFLNNITDEKHRIEATFAGLSYLGLYSPPRTWGLKLGRKF